LQKKYNDLGFADVKVSETTLADWFCLLYKVQGAPALPAIQRGDLKHLVEAGMSNFIVDICNHI
jgi:hypothetical protein